jgi:DNA ligase 1
MQLHDLVETSRLVAEASGRLDKARLLADALRRASPETIETAVALLSGGLRQGRIGIGWSTLQSAMPAKAADEPTLTLDDLDAAMDRLIEVSGAGSAKERVRMIADLLARATGAEQDFLMRAMLGELRQGALEGLMVDAVAQAANLPAADIRRALMVQGDLGAVGRLALSEGASGLARLAMTLFRPVKPMLAQTAADPAEALAQLGRAAFEYKIDGARIQVHKDGGEVRVYTRSLNDVTGSVPEVVEAVGVLPVRTLVLDGEAVAMRRDGRPEPFQLTMRRFGRKLDVARLRQEIPLTCFFFDCLYADGEALIGRPYEARIAALLHHLPPALIFPSRVTGEVAEAAAFLEDALAGGHEGVMAKALDSTYEAGSRGSSWLKIKPAVTLDLVVLAAEWGHGRRQGWLSNLHLGARDPETGGFVMLGKTFKGMTDEMLRWQTEALQKRAVKQDGHTVHVRPELVVEIAFNDIQASPHYAGGLALRFARVKRYRPDKRAEDADTIETVRRLYGQRLGTEAKEEPSAPSGAVRKPTSA